MDIENLERLSMSPSEAWLSYCLLSEVLKRPLFLPVRRPAPPTGDKPTLSLFMLSGHVAQPVIQGNGSAIFGIGSRCPDIFESTNG